MPWLPQRPSVKSARVDISRRMFITAGVSAAAVVTAQAGHLGFRKQVATVVVPDLVPDDWSASWPAVSGSPLLSTITGPTVVPVGYSAMTTFTVTGGFKISVNGGAATTSGNFSPTDSVAWVLDTPGGYLTTTTGALSVASGALVIPLSVTTIAQAGDAAMTLIATQRKEFDLTTLLSGFNDTGNKITVSVTNPSGKFSVRIWKMRDLVGGDDFSFVKNELLRYFQMITLGASQGDACTVTFTGYTGPNGTGSQQTQTLVGTCDLTPPTDVTWNPLLVAQFGGLAVHKYFPGDMADWHLSNDNSGQFDVLRDATARTELGSRRSYPTGYLRVVLKAKTTNPNGMDLVVGSPTRGNQAASAPYGGTPNVIPSDGTTSSFTLRNDALNQSVTVTVHWSLSARIGCAPWPAIDSIAITGRPTWQAGWYTRLGNSVYLRYARRYELMDGDHIYSNSGTWQPGFTFGGGNTAIGGTAPTTMFASSDQHPLDGTMPVYNSNLFTWEGETPDVYVKDFQPNSTSINSASTVLGWHLTGVQARNILLSSSRTLIVASKIWVHDPSDPLANLSLQIKPIAKPGIIYCWLNANLNFAGTDGQVVGNLFETNYNVFDIMNFTGVKENSNDASPIGLVAFNDWIGCQGLGGPHKDGYQFTSSSAPPGSSTVFGSSTSHIWIGNIWYESGRGGQHDNGSGLLTCPWAEVFYPVPLNHYCNIKWLFFGNISVSNCGNGFWFHNPDNGTRVRYNMNIRYFAPSQVTNSSPNTQLNIYPVGGTTAGAWQHGVNDIDVKFEYNIVQGGIDFSLLTNTGNNPSNWGFAAGGGGTFTNTDQINTFVNAQIFGAVLDRADICAAYANDNGVTCLQNPINRPEIDMRRYKGDIATLAA
jgi:hypothetical protein